MLDDASMAITGRSLRMKEETVRKAMDPKYIIENRNILGGPGRKQVIRMLKGHVRETSKNKEWVKGEEAKIKKAKDLVCSLMKRIRARR
jgi:hypothetical protein